jgi:Protein of unknown function (DUF3592)
MTVAARPTQQIRFTRKGLLWLSGIFLGVSVLSLPQYLRIKESAKWPSAPGVITSSWMRSGVCKGIPCYHGEIEYQYHVGDVGYRGTAFDLGRSHWAAQSSWQLVLDQHPVGKAVRVYYEPQHPNHAVLEPGLIGETSLLYKMVLAMIGLFGFCFLATLIWYQDPQPSVAELHANSRRSL